jgi:hypothetical protein
MVLPLYLQICSGRIHGKTKGNTLESSIYKNIFEELSNKETQNEITKEFPKPEIHRRPKLFYCPNHSRKRYFTIVTLAESFTSI